MKTLIFSDTHLTPVFDKIRFDYLQSLFQKYDQIIINGDFWDGYETTFAKFIRSQWKDLFPLLLEKNTIYLWGNHDKPKWTTDPNMFSVAQYDAYTLTVGKLTLHIEHGHRLAPSFDISYPKFSYFLSSLFSSRRFQFGRKLRGWENMQMKQYGLTKLNNDEILVCGHSHIAEYSKRNRYINTGLIDYGIANYLVVIGQKISFITETYA